MYVYSKMYVVAWNEKCNDAYSVNTINKIVYKAFFKYEGYIYIFQ